MQILAGLFTSFAMIGLGAYGGGLVTIPLIQHEIVEHHHWMEFDEMAQIVAIAQMTPGPIAVNAATFTGYRRAGIPGAVAATAAVVLPSLIILLLLAPFVERFKRNRSVRKLQRGIQIGVLSLLLFAAWSYGVSAVKGWREFLMAALSFLVLAVLEGKLHPIAVILSCGIVGMLVF